VRGFSSAADIEYVRDMGNANHRIGTTFMKKEERNISALTSGVPRRCSRA
jgi:hypothetical protein